MSALYRRSRAVGIEVRDDLDGGSGSHGSLIFLGKGGTTPIRLVFVNSREISPGVQRSILQYVRNLTAVGGERDRSFVLDVLTLLQECFSCAR